MEEQLTNAVNYEPSLQKQQYTPSKSEALREYEINIRFLSSGCVVKVGCKEIAFSSNDDAIVELNEYFENPFEAQKKWNKKFRDE